MVQIIATIIAILVILAVAWMINRHHRNQLMRQRINSVIMRARRQ